MLDYRTPENRREGFIRYYAAMIASCDIDPAFATISEIFRRYELSREQQFWVAFIYTIFYHNASTFLFMQEFPELEKVDLPRLERWLTKNVTALQFQHDRRWNRYQVYKMVADYKRVIGAGTQEEFFSRFKTFDDIWQWMMKDGVYNVGRHSAVAWIETLVRCLNIPLTADFRVLLVPTAKSSLEGLRIALDMPDAKPADLKRPAADLMRDCGTDDWMYFETVCCAYKGLMRGNRYLGYYLDRMAGEIVSGQETMRAISEGVNWETLWEIRSEVFPRQFLGECQTPPWCGIRKDKLTDFELTGRL
jgi:hypothetical protein